MKLSIVLFANGSWSTYNDIHTLEEAKAAYQNDEITAVVPSPKTTTQHGDMYEANVTVENTQLEFAQVMALRVAVSNFLADVSDPKYAAKLGKQLAQGYAANLRTVEALLVNGGNKHREDAQKRK